MTTKQASNVVRLVRAPAAPPGTGAAATIEALQGLLRRAHEGRLHGLAWVEFLGAGNYAVQTVGEADLDPTWTRGCVAVLDDELKQRIHEAGQAAPDFVP